MAAYSVLVGKILEGHYELDEEKVKSYAELLAQHYDADGEPRAARIIRSKLDGSYKDMPKAVLQ